MARLSGAAVTLTGLAVTVICLTYSVLLLDKRLLELLAAREGPLEQVGALLFLMSAVFSFLAFAALRKQPRAERVARPAAFLLLAVFFCVAFGEEISWGSLMISRHQDRELFPNNVQNELNIHNLTIFDEYTKTGNRKTGLQTFLTANRLFDYFMITTFLIIPWAAAGVPSIRNWFDRLKIPFLPAAFSVALITNLALTIIAEKRLVNNDKFLHGAVSEIREVNYALLCFLGVIFLYLCILRTRSQSVDA